MEKIIVDESIQNVRLDKALSLRLPKSRTQIESYIKDGLVKVNEKSQKGSYKLVLGDVIVVDDIEEKVLDIAKENLKLDIIYEDDDVAVVNKPSGMVVHPACGNEEHTLVNGLLYQMDIKASINGVFRPGIVHRIDKDTSGLLMVAKNDEALQALPDTQAVFRE